jgi:hypothetical protein
VPTSTSTSVAGVMQDPHSIVATSAIQSAKRLRA